MIEWELKKGLFLSANVDGRYWVEVEEEDEYVMKIYDNMRAGFLVDRITFDIEDPDKYDVKEMEQVALESIAAYEDDDYDAIEDEVGEWNFDEEL